MELLLPLYLRISGFDHARFTYTALIALIPCVIYKTLHLFFTSNVATVFDQHDSLRLGNSFCMYIMFLVAVLDRKAVTNSGSPSLRILSLPTPPGLFFSSLASLPKIPNV